MATAEDNTGGQRPPDRDMRTNGRVARRVFHGRTIGKVMGGGGEFSVCANFFFFRSLLVQNFFFQVKPSARIFYSDKYYFFSQWNPDSLSVFVCFINYSTLTTDQRIRPLFNAKSRTCTHSERGGSHWSGRLPCAFFQSLPSGIPLPQPTIMMPYSIHQNSPSVVPSTPKCQSKKKVLV